MSQTGTLKAPLSLTEDQIIEIQNRPASFKEADISCVRAIAQAAINVELFTIPLYMTALYSIQGTHQINSKNSSLYEGRWWPGTGPTAGDIDFMNGSELTPNEQVFNNVYSVFVEEMLHLQLASNMASKIGVTPSFTSSALQDEQYGWKCYDAKTNNQTIPHILDFKDCKDNLDVIPSKYADYFRKRYPTSSLQDMQVKLDAMNPIQSLLFIAIEETEEDAHEVLQQKYWNPNDPNYQPTVNGEPKYFEQAPYDWWKASNTESDLPLFGSIGHMYLCYWNYLEIKYDDGTTLLDMLVNTVQRDRFNDHPDLKQYPGISGEIEIDVDQINLKTQLINNINAITDQGEGGSVVENILSYWKEEKWAKNFLLAKTSSMTNNHVDAKFQPDAKSLVELYPGYNELGKPDGISGSAFARISNKSKDHYETFVDCLEIMIFNEMVVDPKNDRYMTWDIWHQEMGANPWTKEMLQPNPKVNSSYKLPTAESIATALNNLGAADKKDETHGIFSLSAVGTIKGLTTVLDNYWSGKTDEFPGPAMAGSGDRVSICWASTGMIPDLVTGIKSPVDGKLYNACQGMNYMASDPTKVNPELMPDVETYHSCKGSNGCMAQGGCGFVQSDKGGGSCSQSVASSAKQAGTEASCCSHAPQSQKKGAGCGMPDIKSAPANNKCGSLGGCAVPISASQLYPSQEESDPMMKLYEFVDGPDGYHAKSIDTMLRYKEGDSVYDTAWKAYWISIDDKQTDVNLDVTEEKIGDTTIVTATVKHKPTTTDIRLALPPST